MGNMIFMLGLGFLSGWLLIGLVLGMAGVTAGYIVNIAVLSSGCFGSVLASRAVKACAGLSPAG